VKSWNSLQRESAIQVLECVLKQGGRHYGKLCLRDDLRKVNVPNPEHNKHLLQEWDGVLVNAGSVFSALPVASPSLQEALLSIIPRMVFLSFVPGDFALFRYEWLFFEILVMNALANLLVPSFANASQYDVTVV
jgi:hypothetical protein